MTQTKTNAGCSSVPLDPKLTGAPHNERKNDAELKN